MGVSVKEPPPEAWSPMGVSPHHDVRCATDSHLGVSKLSSDLLMYLEPVTIWHKLMPSLKTLSHTKQQYIGINIWVDIDFFVSY